MADEISPSPGKNDDVRLSPNDAQTSCNTAHKEPSVKPSRPTTRPKGVAIKKDKGKKKTKSTDETEVGAKASIADRMDRLEGLLETFISGFYDEESQIDQSNFDAHTSSSSAINTEATNVCNTNSGTNSNTGSDFSEVNPTKDSQDTKSETEINLGFAARFATPSKEGPAVDEELANSLSYLVATKLEEKQLNDTTDKYNKPSNCQNLVVPKVNPLIWDNINSKTRSMDLKIQRCEKPLIKGLIALATSLGGKTLSNSEQDALALFSNAVFELNLLRKELIKPDINHKFSHLCKHTNKPSQFLFGDDLPKSVKELEEEHKTVGAMKLPKRNFASRFNPLRFSQMREKHRQAGWVRPSRPFLGEQRLQRPYPRHQSRDRSSTFNSDKKFSRQGKQFHRN